MKDSNNEIPVCPNPDCENPFPHAHTDGSYSCEECGTRWDKNQNLQMAKEDNLSLLAPPSDETVRGELMSWMSACFGRFKQAMYEMPADEALPRMDEVMALMNKGLPHVIHISEKMAVGVKN